MPNIAIPAEFADAPMQYARAELRPKMTVALNALSQAVHQHSKLPLRVREAARARIAEINGCLLCQRYRPAAQAPIDNMPSDQGPAPDEAFYRDVSNWRASESYNEREKVAIDYAERFALAPDPLGYDQEFWMRAKSVYSESEIYDLTISIAAYLAAGRVTHVLGFDQNACSIANALEDWGLDSRPT